MKNRSNCLASKQNEGRVREPRTYRIYGFSVRSDWELQYCELQEDTEPFVELIECSLDDLREALAEAATLPHPDEWYELSHLHDGSTFFHFPSLFNFLISADGRRVLGHRLTDAYAASFYTYLLAFALSYALLELGIEQLHATCVLINGSAAAFIGKSGHGKSTLAGMFVRSGYKLITDDMLVLSSRHGVFYVSPGLRRIKLFPEIAQRLLGEHVRGTPMNPLTEKMIIPLAAGQCHSAEAPLKALYVLAPPATRTNHVPVQITQFSGINAFIELCKATFNIYMSKPARLKEQFRFATQVASCVPVKLLSYGDSLDSLDLVRDAVLSDLG